MASQPTPAAAAGGGGAAGGAPARPPARVLPQSLGLRADFRLTDFSKLKG